MLGFLLFVFLTGLIWRNFYNILVFINGVYLNGKDWYLKNDFNYNSYKEISKEIILDKDRDNKKVVIYDYKFRGSDYKIICDEDKFTTQPYTINYIDQKQESTSLKLLKSTKDDIISAELVLGSISDPTQVARSIDYHEETQKICGPLGDFYEDTVVTTTKDNLRLYIKNRFSSHDVREFNIMTSDGEEHNLLEN